MNGRVPHHHSSILPTIAYLSTAQYPKDIHDCRPRTADMNFTTTETTHQVKPLRHLLDPVRYLNVISMKLLSEALLKKFLSAQ